MQNQLTRGLWSSPRAIRRLRPTTPSFRSLSSQPQASLLDVRPGPVQRSRFEEHYKTTMAADMMYMAHDHELASNPPTPLALDSRLPPWDPLDPYTINRPSRTPRGNRPVPPTTKPVEPSSVVRLESIVLHSYQKEAINNKHHLVGLIMALQAITGEPDSTGVRQTLPRGTRKGVELVKTKKGAASFKVRSGMPIGAKVELKGESMYAFLETLVEFVLPRLKDWSGVPLPPAALSRSSPSALGGVVSFGLPHSAMQLFPQIEINYDSYPRSYGFHIHFITNARGKAAQDQARLLLSGMRVPFVKR